METPPSTSKPFTRLTDDSAFTRRHRHLHSTTVFILRPPRSLSSDRPWITAREITPKYAFTFRHPLTNKPHSVTLPKTLDLVKLRASAVALSYRIGDSDPVDKLFVFPPSTDFSGHYDAGFSGLLALYGGGQLQGCPRHGPEEIGSGSSPWGKLFPDYKNLDDITNFGGKIHAVNREGWVGLILTYKTSRKIKVSSAIMFGSGVHNLGRFGWRKRFVVDGGNLYLVVRTAEKSFRVYMVDKGGNGGRSLYWCETNPRGFAGDRVLFMARDYYFFRKASGRFLGSEYRNSIVFSEAAFPQYGEDGWEFTQSGGRRFSEEDVAVFRFGDEVFAREGEDSSFPKLDWSPPAWIFDSPSVPAHEFSEHSVSESSYPMERDKNDGEVQSDLKDSDGKNEEEQEEMEADFVSQDQDQDGVESDSNNQDQDDGNMQCDSSSQKTENDEVMHFKENIDGNASLLDEGRTEVATRSLSDVVEGVTRTLLHGGSPAIEGNGSLVDGGRTEVATHSLSGGVGTTRRSRTLLDRGSPAIEGNASLLDEGKTEVATPSLSVVVGRTRRRRPRKLLHGGNPAIEGNASLLDKGRTEVATPSLSGGVGVTRRSRTLLHRWSPSIEGNASLLDEGRSEVATPSLSALVGVKRRRRSRKLLPAIEGNASLLDEGRTEIPMRSLSAVVEEVTKTLLHGGSPAIQEETPGKNSSDPIPIAFVPSTPESHKTDPTTTKFEGFDIRSDLVPTLQKIWRKHGNILKKSIVRSGDIVARSLESLATIVRILENNPAQSLSDSQADYLSSTLSDLKSIRFNVIWLSASVEKALKIHKNKALVDSLNNLTQLSSQVKKRKAILLDEVAKLNEEENKLKDEMAKVSKKIPFSEKIKFDEPVGVDLT